MERYPTIAEAVASFIAELRMRGQDATARNYRSQLKPLAALPVEYVHEVTAADVNQLVLGRRAEISDSSLRTFVYALRGFFRWTLEQGFTHTNPAERTPKPPVRAPEHRWLSKRQLRAMWDAAANDDDRLILLLAGAAGLRAGELVGLRFRDVDPGERVARFFGKGKKSREVAVDELALVLIATRGGKPNDRILERLHYSGLHKRVVRMAQRAGLRQVTPHQLRHSFAMAFLDRSGGDAFALQDLLGHESPTMTGYYVRSWRQRNATRRQREVDLPGWLFGDD